jgi:hypothetical protein
MGSICDSRKQINNFNITEQTLYIHEEEELLKKLKRHRHTIDYMEKDMRITQVK